VITNEVLSSQDDSEFLNPDPMTFALVQNTGLVTLVYGMSSLITRCALDVYKFPFDQQKCDIHIGSWAMSDDKLNFAGGSYGISTEFFIKNPVWDLEETGFSFTNSKDRYSYHLPNYNIKEVKFRFILKRRPLYFMINSVFPCLVLNVLTVMSFFLPTMPQFTISK
jgi:hypothetical protein